MMLVAGQLGVLLATMLVGDELTTLEPRILWPLGATTVAAFAWWVERPPTRTGGTLVTLAALWLLFAAPPTRWSLQGTLPRTPVVVVAEETGAKVVVTTSTDPLHFLSGVPAAYFPRDVDALTGKRLDTTDQYRALPCALAKAEGIAVVDLTGFGPSEQIVERLGEHVRLGRLIEERRDDVIVYRPAEDLEDCSPAEG
jgi:hypothetical protein